ncbi:MAG: ParB/RepB/Spo0J family partition protein [Bacteroidaceae bacterium]|nr:ParB/RepB/Spo0J family partition protein [Bacteroidaceae bacterium]
MASQKKHTGLGRGLDALISTDAVQTQGSSSISEIPIAEIKANPNQPRREFDQAALQELAESIKAIGIVQPITLRKLSSHSYQIIAGERRYRASLLAGLTTMPAYIRTADDENVMEMALIENIQREDLNAMEIALAYQHLLEEYELTQDKLSERVGKNRATIANYLRLLKLPAEIQMALNAKELDMGHARALLALSSPVEQIKLYHEIRQNGYSVRKVEELVKERQNAPAKSHDSRKPSARRMSQDFGLLKKHLSSFFKTDVKLTCNDSGKGKISIPFEGEEELERIIRMLDKIKN